MLEPAIKYVSELEELHRTKTWFQEKYKYWVVRPYHSMISIDKRDTYDSHQFVSIKDGEILGFIFYNIDRETESVSSVSIMNLSDDIYTFGADLKRAFMDIFEKYNFRKLNFCVVVGNPVEKSYDKLVKKYGGRIVGIKKQHVKLIDNKLYDLKEYEILRKDYFNTRRKIYDNRFGFYQRVDAQLSRSN